MSLEVGAIVEGEVSGITNFGAFVQLPEGKVGLIHISEVSNVYVKDVREFLKEHDKLSVKAGIVGGEVMNEAQLKALSSLPNKDGMISMLLSVLQAPIRGLACAIKAVSEKE